MRIRRSVSRVLFAQEEERDGHSSGTPIAGRLVRSTLTAHPGNAMRPLARPCRLYSILLPAGLAVPSALLQTRCALTAPFHPCSLRSGLFSVALSLGSPPPGVTRRRVSMEPGLSSAGAVRRRRPSDRLIEFDYAATGRTCQASSARARRRCRMARVCWSATPSTRQGRKCRCMACSTVARSESGCSPCGWTS